MPTAVLAPNKLDWEGVERKKPLQGTDIHYMYAFFRVNKSRQVHMLAVRDDPVDSGQLAEAIVAVLLDTRLKGDRVENVPAGEVTLAGPTYRIAG